MTGVTAGTPEPTPDPRAIDNRKVEKSDDGRWYVDDGVGVEFFESEKLAAEYLDIVQRLDARRESARWLRSDLAHARSAGESYKRRLDAASAELVAARRALDDERADQLGWLKDLREAAGSPPVEAWLLSVIGSRFKTLAALGVVGKTEPAEPERCLKGCGGLLALHLVDCVAGSVAETETPTND